MSDSEDSFGITTDLDGLEWTTVFGVSITANTLNNQQPQPQPSGLGEGLQQPHSGQWSQQLQLQLQPAQSNEWAQVPPAVMPWGAPDGNLPNIITFTGQPNQQFPSVLPPQVTPHPSHLAEAAAVLAQKRKCEPDAVERPVKMFITEEKMAAQLQNMHISNKYISQNESGGSDFEAVTSLSTDDLPTLTLSKEVQNLPPLEPMLPDTILTGLRKQTQALVLWKPPVGELGDRLKELIRLTRSEEEEQQRDTSNNNTSTPDLNSMLTPVVYAMDEDKTDDMDV